MRKYSFLDSIMSGLLIWDVLTEFLVPIDYMNYVYILYFVIRMIALQIGNKKRTDDYSDKNHVAQHGGVLGTIARFFFFITAVIDVF